jgi:hypothetical protein
VGQAHRLLEARANARWSLEFVHDQFASGRRFRILNVVDGVTRECLAAIPDTSISGRRVARELTGIAAGRMFSGRSWALQARLPGVRSIDVAATCRIATN